MSFTRNFAEDPLRGRVYLLLHSEPKVGKTRAVLNLIREHGNYVVMLSFDSGTLEVRQSPTVFQGKLALATPKNLQEVRKDIEETDLMIEKLYRKGVHRSKIWVCVDTVTALQHKLMIEARKVNVKNPEATDRRREFVRDAVTEIDYNINLVHMGEVADWLAGLACNVVVNALSREETVERKKTGRVVPAISGQSGLRFNGDADAILYLNRDDSGKRWFEIDSETGGDRSGMLDAKEPADLLRIQRKMLGKTLDEVGGSSTDPTDAKTETKKLESETEKHDAPAADATGASS